uniref:DNA polymerase V n=1 Tax=Ananas comosus var. bracteatus TaxID=296719 RepID=A0A6V7P0I1_ANACO|nr:unnamed protein product [Ananas comosus var. bracteatus]
MAGKKRPSSAVEDGSGGAAKAARLVEGENGAAAAAATRRRSIKAKAMKVQRRKLRKEWDKERNRLALEIEEQSNPRKPPQRPPTPAVAPTTDLPALRVIVFRDLASSDASKKLAEDGAVQLEAEKKDDGLENCSPSLRYAIRRLIRGVSSSRECARQGFALGLTLVAGTFPVIKVEVLMKLIVEMLEVSSSMKRQDAKDNLLGRLFAYGSLARSGRIAAEWISDNSTQVVKNFVSDVIALAGKKRYLSEPAVSVILDMVEKLPDEALPTEVLKAPGMHEWFENASEVGDPDALFLALKLQERLNTDSEMFGKLLPAPFSPDKFFTRDHLLSIAPCFKESIFCLPRLHSLWPFGDKYANSRNSFSTRCFCAAKLLPPSCIEIALSSKLVHCLMDVLTHEKSELYNAGQHFLMELLNIVGDDDERRAAAVLSFRKYSNGKFDSITKTQTVKQLVAKFNTGSGCMLFVHKLISLFVDEGPFADEPSDQSQTTDENSEVGSIEEKDPPSQGTSNSEFLQNWIIDTMPRVLKNLSLDTVVKSLKDAEEVTKSDLMSLPDSVKVKFVEEKFRVQTEIMKFLAVQGLFSASLGTEVTSFELQEKFKWPKAAISSSLCSIPSVSLYRTLSNDDEKAFKEILAMESRLFHEERKIKIGPDANKMHAFRYLLIQLLLQVLLRPDKFFEAAIDLVICCKKAFPAAALGDSSEEDEYNGNDAPKFMDVFGLFCDEITEPGLIQMLKIVRKDLKPRRSKAAGSDTDEDDEDDDFIDMEDANESDFGGSDDDHADESERKSGADDMDEEVNKNDEVDSEKIEPEVRTENDGDIDGSDDSDAMDDDAMFNIEPHLGRLFKERKISGNESFYSQLMPFKLRVLTLLEIYLHKNPGKTQVLTVCSSLIKAFVDSHVGNGSKQLQQRIGGIIQKKIFKAKDYPKDDSVDLSTLEALLGKSVWSASHSRFKAVASLAQNSTFWVLKIIDARNFPKPELERVVDIFRNTLVDYFNNKNSRLKIGFLKEAIRRYPWIGVEIFGFLLEKCGSAKYEFRRVEALDLLDCIIRCVVPSSKGEQETDGLSALNLLKRHLPAICELIGELLTNWPEKQSRRKEVRRFCIRVLDIMLKLNLKKAFLKILKPDVYTLCQSKLGDAFKPFSMANQ